MRYSPKYIDFVPILLYVNINLSCFTKAARHRHNILGFILILWENVGFSHHSSAYFPVPTPARMAHSYIYINLCLV